MAVIQYNPPPTLRKFIKSHKPGSLFYDWVVGPVGSGKTTAIFMKLIVMAQKQEPGPDGIRRTRAVVVRNTLPQLRDTTLSSWNYWFKPDPSGKSGVGNEWRATEWKFILRFGDVECEVLFRPLDTPQDVARVLSLEVTFALIDEFVEIPRQIVDALSARCGRYPSAIMGGATNWGMWGSSNPSTEDNWWFGHLHDQGIHVQPKEDDDAARDYDALVGSTRNARYFLQPSGFADDAENVENLPGKREYYTNQAKGKSDTWIKQFLEAEWGYSIAGKPVVSSFRSDLHLSKKPLEYNPGLKLVAGFDPGVGGAAMIFGQEDFDGRLLVLGEVIAQGKGVTRFIQEDIRPYIRRRFPDLDLNNFVVAPDPAAGNRAMTDERTVVDILKKYFNVSIESNNRLPLRLDAIENYSARLVDGGKPALLLDEKECVILARALKGGWRYALDKKEEIKGQEPEKNSYSHPGDAFGYLARYYHRHAARNERYVAAGVKPFVPPRRFGGNYHFR